MNASHHEAVAATRVNPGETLRRARESRNWELTDVAAQLNLTAQALRQLEDGAFDQLPGHTFARGYIRAYAKLLGMDQTRLVQEFDQYTGTDATGSSVHSLGRIEEPVRLSQNLLRFVSFALLAVLAAVGFFWWQEQSSNRGEERTGLGIEHVEVESADGTTQIHPLDEPEDQAVAEASGDQAELPLPSVSPEVAGQPESDAEPSAPSDAASTGEAPSASTEPETPAQPESVTPPATPPAAPVAVQPGEGMVRMQFTANCWTQITDATGKVLYSGLKREGESLDVSGKAPLKLHLGYARGVQVSFNGQTVDLAPYVRGETARFTLGGQ
ncbi:Cro/Cl family transcriptional regulator [Pseudomonas sp. PIC25]|uniref:RodZ domain-containing protein n=1 Tax=Pseudomonas sp. PIC25 TaxID=1958773 RepID=UPI000BABFDBA|nr:RodZ family helix-turn-helix domain-containing protein [Pseudomonas sp. PIC25]PAU65109.1 Cro/Cl family transcriptional regulator [Pseudomonas sp. PIC25]